MPAVLPDLLTGSRLVLGPAFVVLLPQAPAVAFLLAMLASLTDFFDGRLARRFGGGSARGAVLDVLGDAVFVLLGLGALAWHGVLSVALPVAAGVSLLALARVWRARPPGTMPGPRGAADQIGHWAGILNYGAVVVGSGFVAFEIPLSLVGASQLVAALNIAPILMRWRK